MPYQHMTHYGKIIFFAKLYKTIRLFKIVNARFRMNVFPFHIVYGSNGVKMFVNHCTIQGIFSAGFPSESLRSDMRASIPRELTAGARLA